jgi:DNA-binding PadR family transcriptional regulator
LPFLLDGPKHGYQLKREARFILGHGEMHNNLVYPLLRRFTTNGWVTKRTVPGDRGQTRQQYAITPAGRRELITRLSKFGESEAASWPGFITRVGMFEALEEPVRASILAARTNSLQVREQKLTLLEQNTDLGMYGGEVVRYLIEQIHSELAWIRRLHRLAASAKSSHHKIGRKV